MSIERESENLLKIGIEKPKSSTVPVLLLGVVVFGTAFFVINTNLLNKNSIPTTQKTYYTETEISALSTEIFEKILKEVNTIDTTTFMIVPDAAERFTLQQLQAKVTKQQDTKLPTPQQQRTVSSAFDLSVGEMTVIDLINASLDSQSLYQMLQELETVSQIAKKEDTYDLMHPHREAVYTYATIEFVRMLQSDHLDTYTKTAEEYIANLVQEEFFTQDDARISKQLVTEYFLAATGRY